MPAKQQQQQQRPNSHPTISDVAMALATRQPRSDQSKKVALVRNASGNVQVSVEAGGTEWDDVLAARDVFDSLCAEYPRGETR